MELREELIAAFEDFGGLDLTGAVAGDLADMVLDIPAIRAAKIVAESSPEWVEEHFGAELACELHPGYAPVYNT